MYITLGYGPINRSNVIWLSMITYHSSHKGNSMLILFKTLEPELKSEDLMS